MNKKLVLNKETVRVLNTARPKQDNQVMMSDPYTRTCTRACD